MFRQANLASYDPFVAPFMIVEPDIWGTPDSRNWWRKSTAKLAFHPAVGEREIVLWAENIMGTKSAKRL
jgi:hypothetical protein